MLDYNAWPWWLYTVSVSLVPFFIHPWLHTAVGRKHAYPGIFCRLNTGCRSLGTGWLCIHRTQIGDSIPRLQRQEDWISLWICVTSTGNNWFHRADGVFRLLGKIFIPGLLNYVLDYASEEWRRLGISSFGLGNDWPFARRGVARWYQCYGFIQKGDVSGHRKRPKDLEIYKKSVLTIL